MFRSTSRLVRRRLAGTLLALAIAPQVGCGYVHDFMTWRHRGQAALQSHEGAADVTQGKRDRMREARAHAWESVDKGGSAGDYSTDDALALSAAARALDARVTWDASPAAGRAKLAICLARAGGTCSCHRAAGHGDRSRSIANGTRDSTPR